MKTDDGVTIYAVDESLPEPEDAAAAERARFAAYNRERRAKAKALGKCATCVTQWAEPGLTHCGRCLGRVDDRRGMLQRQQLYCIECQATGFHRADCPTRSN